ncbi:MAG: hypothetical protein AAGA56_09280 [Myxococcota bacterium]
MRLDVDFHFQHRMVQPMGAMPKRAHRPISRAYPAGLGLLVGVLAATTSSCSDDTTIDLGPPSDASWLYLQTTIADPEGRTSYVQVLSSFDEAPDLDRAVELAGNARVFSDGRRLFTGGAEAPIIQEWFPSTDGQLIPGERLSLAGEGLAFVPFGNNFVAEDKAYLFDGPNARVLIWDPTLLEARGEIDLSPVRKGDLLPEIDPGVLRDDGLLFATVQQNDFGSVNVFRGIQIVVIDTIEDRIVAVHEDTRCVGSFAGMGIGDDQTVYVMGDNYLVYNWDDTFPATCILRIPPGQTEFDPDFMIDLDALLGNPATGMFLGANNRIYTQDMDPEFTDVNPIGSPLAFLNERVSRWYEIDLDDPTEAIPLDELGRASPRSGRGFSVDGRFFLPLAEEGFIGRTRLVELLGAGGTEELFAITGLATNFGRLNSAPRSERLSSGSSMPEQEP